MNETIIYNWNNTVTLDDTIYCLGDFGFGPVNNLLPLFNRLNGKKILIRGNHDKKDVIKLPWDSIHDILEVKYQNITYNLCHYPDYHMRTCSKSSYDTRYLFGHCHGALTPHNCSCDVGMDCWGFTPVSILQLDKLFENLPKNINETILETNTIWNAIQFMDKIDQNTII